MQARQATWADLHLGAYFREDGVVWKIEKERDFNYLGVSRDGERRRFHPRDGRSPVTMLVPSEEEALAALKKTVGARVVARRAAGETGWLVDHFPKNPKVPGALDDGRTHIFMMHGIYTGDVKTLAGLIECHEDSHRDPLQGYQEHTHPGGNPS